MAGLLQRKDRYAEGSLAATPSPKRQAVVDAATGLFLEAGYGATSMDAIAARAGVSKRTVYSHFAGKDELFGAVMAHVCVSIIGTQDPARLAGGPPRRVLTDYGCTFLRLIASDQALAIFRVVTAESERFPELGRVFYETGPLRWTEALADYLAAQDRLGTLQVRDPAAAAAQFLALVKGPVHMRLTLGVGPRPDAADIAAVVDSAVEVFLRGYRPGPRGAN